MKKKILISLIIVIILTIIFGVKSFAIDSCKIEFASSSNSPKRMDEIEITVSIKNIINPIAGISYSMVFDHSKLELIGQVQNLNNWKITQIENTFFIDLPNYEATKIEQAICKLKFRVKESASLGKTVISVNDVQIVKDNCYVENLNNIDLILDIGQKENNKTSTDINNGKNQTINRSISKAEVVLNKTSFIYNKKVQKPTIKIIGSDGKKIDSSYYTITYSNKKSKKVGKYTVTISFNGIYESTKILTYIIKPNGTKINKLNKSSKAFNVSWKKQKKETSGYEIQYSTNKKMNNSKKVKVKKNNTTSITIKKLKNNTRYYVKIRTYKNVKVNGKNKKIYSGWSKIKKITTK